MYKLTIKYSDNTISIKYFQSWEKADWYAHNEGDHAINWEIEEIK